MFAQYLCSLHPLTISAVNLHRLVFTIDFIQRFAPRIIYVLFWRVIVCRVIKIIAAITNRITIHNSIPSIEPQIPMLRAVFRILLKQLLALRPRQRTLYIEIQLPRRILAQVLRSSPLRASCPCSPLKILRICFSIFILKISFSFSRSKISPLIYKRTRNQKFSHKISKFFSK